jgi:hypothetical protein
MNIRFSIADQTGRRGGLGKPACPLVGVHVPGRHFLAEVPVSGEFTRALPHCRLIALIDAIRVQLECLLTPVLSGALLLVLRATDGASGRLESLG